MWTLVRHRNGQEVPIKVSVLDVFRSGSRRDRKPGEESHLVKPKANTKAAIAPKTQGGGGGGNNNNKKNPSVNTNTNTTNNNNHWSTSDPETWTAEDDAQLRDLKTNGNMSWKQVLAALSDKHTSESQMKAHWKEIEGKPVGGGSAAGEGGGGDDDKAKKEEERKAKAEKAKAEGLAKQAAAKAGEGGGQPKKGILKTSTARSATSQEKDLKDVAAKYDKDKWLAVASRHFDRTGQRISPEMAKEMCGATD